jgi:hypothetical protein
VLQEVCLQHLLPPLLKIRMRRQLLLLLLLLQNMCPLLLHKIRLQHQLLLLLLLQQRRLMETTCQQWQVLRCRT